MPLSHLLQESGAAILDVHVPHATHTWKDFFIHIATICVGLLIAIGLEQGVEFLHHRSQASRLEEDLRKEADQNVRIIDSDTALDLPELAWASSAMQALRDAPLHRGFVAVVLPPAPPVSKTYAVGDTVMNTTPSHSVWTIAQSTGQVELLPLNRAKVYDRLEFEATQYVVVANASDIEGTKFVGVLRSLNVKFDPGETLHLTAAHRDDLVQAVNQPDESLLRFAAAFETPA
jgi:hypothetical protein